MDNSTRQIQRIGIGFAVSFLVLSIALGNPSAVASLIGASVICTLGIGLVIWLPLWWLTGWIILTLLEGIGVMRQPVQATRPVVRDTIALTRYIQHGRLIGASDSQIIARLREQGWTDAEIDRALRDEFSELGDR